MNSTADLREIFYVSTIASDAPLRVVADIAVKSRNANRLRKITGLLVFDGLHFCQQIEGATQEIGILMESILKDRRHTNVRILHDGPLELRRFGGFSLGYASMDEVDLLDRLAQLRGQAAIDTFLSMLSSLDVHG